MIVSGLHGVIHSYLTKIIIDTVDKTNGSNVFQAALWPALFFIVGYEVHNLSWRGANFVNLRIQAPIKESIIKHTFAMVHKQAYQFFHDTFAGSIASNIHILVESIEMALHHHLMHVVRGTILLTASLVSMYFVNPLFFITLLIWMVGFVSVSFFVSKKVKQFSDAYARSQSEVSGRVVDSITNAQNVRIFSAARFELSYLEKFLSIMKNRFQVKERFLLIFYLMQGISISVLIAAMLYILIHLKSKGLVTTGDFALILTLTIYVTDHSWWLTEQINHLHSYYGKCQQCLVSLYKPLEIQDNINAEPLIVTKGQIVFEKVKFHYKGAQGLFDDKSVTIEPGQKVGLVGYSGGGKTTFVNLIMRLYDINQGRILIDGKNIKEVTQDSLNKAIGLIPQDPSLFHRTLKENIRYGRLDASEEEVINAARKAHADDFINKLPHGYDALVG
ncbi:MAG TPA: ABC transporter ATP-binding protein, partial [Candidatus Berkiella sp.]|nr:ABC transporter ATP-binding protein [Candidatus Berkiella sp.]